MKKRPTPLIPLPALEGMKNVGSNPTLSAFFCDLRVAFLITKAISLDFENLTKLCLGWSIAINIGFYAKRPTPLIPNSSEKHLGAQAVPALRWRGWTTA